MNLPTNTNETSPTMIVITMAAIAVGGYFGYASAFPNERKQVRSCISSMMVSSRGQVGYGELRSKLQALDAAETIEITDETRRAFGNSTLVTIEYRVDGQASRTMCGQ